MSRTPTKSSKRPAKGFTLGRQGFAKISEIEGIKMSRAMAAEFREFDRKGLSPEERRKAIAAKYGKTR
ncbi:hypothetical protein [uncultured Parvibaculum sp.]|uniref:hypothetical protein n=1 Tax=uncultured Parvibaculum sp. TaxID=291828 RepID=UPI0030EF7A9C|tara:strand:+ start:37033 stop:37236 length:204 start_codon:yes stop_codon:yes gene_type:complete